MMWMSEAAGARAYFYKAGRLRHTAQYHTTDFQVSAAEYESFTQISLTTTYGLLGISEISYSYL